MQIAGSKTMGIAVWGLALQSLVLVVALVVAFVAPDQLGQLAAVLGTISISATGVAGAGTASVGLRHWGAAEGSSAAGAPPLVVEPGGEP